MPCPVRSQVWDGTRRKLKSETWALNARLRAVVLPARAGGEGCKGLEQEDEAFPECPVRAGYWPCILSSEDAVRVRMQTQRGLVTCVGPHGQGLEWLTVVGLG